MSGNIKRFGRKLKRLTRAVSWRKAGIAALAIILLAVSACTWFFQKQDVVFSSGTTALSSSESDDSASIFSVDEITIKVHVCGSVQNPGVYELPENSRVDDAVQAAGGFSDDAAQASVNLARALSDGEQIYIASMSSDDADQAGSPSTIANTTASNTTLININTATAEQLESLPGIGSSTAQKIIAYRTSNGSFQKTEDITQVSGIGDKKYEAIASLICV